MRDRGTYIAAALTICRAFKLAGEPPARPARLVCRTGAISCARRCCGSAGGDAGPHHSGSPRTIRSASAFGAVLAAWEKVFGRTA